MGPIRILIADDHAAVREGVRSVLEKHQGWEVCGEAVDGLDAIEKARSLKPDVVVLDVRMPHLGGLEALVVIKRELPRSEVLILSQHESPDMLSKAMRAGASAFVPKHNADRDLLPAIERVLHK